MIYGCPLLKFVYEYCDISNLIRIILSLAPHVWYVTAYENVGQKTLENFM
jgi:hypothetical protein